MTAVFDDVAETLTRLGVTRIFGLVGSSNFMLTNALIDRGAQFLSSRHEGGAITSGDAYRRVAGTVPVVSLHHGNGLTNAMTGLTEAVKSKTPMLVLVPEASSGGPDLTFSVNQAALVRAVGAEFHEITSPANASRETARAWHRAAIDGATVVLNLPLGVLEATSAGTPIAEDFESTQAGPSTVAVARLVDLLTTCQRPVFIGGRGARGAAAAVRELADASGALLATSVAARGLFAGDFWDLDVAGGFSTVTTADLLNGADLVVAWGAGLNVWTARFGAIFGSDATVVQVDRDPEVLGRQDRVDLGIIGDVGETARAVLHNLPRSPVRTGYRTEAVRARVAEGVHWRDVPFEGHDGNGEIDPRTLTLALDRMIPRERVVCTDVGNFCSYPQLFFTADDERSMCAPVGFASVGLGLATAIGAAIALPERQTVACMGDGGALMGAAEFETVVRERIPMLAVVYNDHAYGAESQQYAPGGHRLDSVVFPETDIASIARGYGWDAITVRTVEDLSPVAEWLAGPRNQPFLVDARIASFPSFVMEHMSAVAQHS